MTLHEAIGQYVKLEKSGSMYMGLCPFHEERTPSFVVNDETESFHCFGCEADGRSVEDFQKLIKK